MTYSTLPILACAGLAALAPAQSRVVPAIAVARDLNAQSFFPWLYSSFRFQQVWDGSAIANQSATITSFAYRRDTQDNSRYVPHTYPQLVLKFGPTSVTPATMSTSFAANATGNQTTVFSGPYNPPTQVPELGVAPFNIVLPLQTPFPYQVASGNLLAELEAPNPQLPKQWYTIDADYYGAEGYTFSFGEAGLFNNGRRPSISMDRAVSGLDRVVPGGQVALRVTGMPSALTTFVNFGLSTQFWVGGPLPQSLAPFGAPGNTLYASLDTVTPPLTPQGSGASWTARFTAPIPAISALAGESFYNQAIVLAPGTNPLGVVLSGGLQMTIGGRTAPVITQFMGTAGVSSSTGRFLFRTGAGGPAAEFGGTFQ